MTTPTASPDEGQTTETMSAATLIDQSLKVWRQRLADLDEEIKPLADEADILRSAILKVERSQQQPNTSTPRARGGARERVLAAITGQAKTAGEISGETGVPTGTVSSALPPSPRTARRSRPLTGTGQQPARPRSSPQNSGSVRRLRRADFFSPVCKRRLPARRATRGGTTRSLTPVVSLAGAGNAVNSEYRSR